MLDVANDTTFAPTSDQIERSIDGLAEIENGVVAQRLRFVAAYDREEHWRADGMSSMAAWVAFRFKCSWPTAERNVRIAHALDQLPHIADAFSHGLLSFDVVDLLTTFVLPEEDEEWATRAQGYNFAQVKMHASAARRLIRKDAELTNDERFLDMQWNHHKGLLRIRGQIAGAEGAAVYETLEHLAKAKGANADGVWESMGQRRADALVELSKAKLADLQPSDTAMVVIHVDLADFNAVNGQAILEDGPYVPSEVARRLACDGVLQMVVRDANGKPIGIGRTSRVIPPKLYRLLKHRDRCCVICGGTTCMEGHHVIHYANGGRTDLDNLVLLCWKCHRLVHDHDFFLVRDQYDAVKLIRPDGKPVRNKPIPLSPDDRRRMLGPQACRRPPNPSKRLE